MNQKAAEALYAAEAAGVKQIKGTLSNQSGGRCALGVLTAMERFDLNTSRVDGCPLCGARHADFFDGGHYTLALTTEYNLIAHLNDDHGLTFSEIARKLGPDSA